MKLPTLSIDVIRNNTSSAGFNLTPAILPSDCHVTSYYKCTGAPDDPWADAYGNGSTCLSAKKNATMAYNQLCYNAGLGTAFFDTTSIDCNCD